MCTIIIKDLYWLELTEVGKDLPVIKSKEPRKRERSPIDTCTDRKQNELNQNFVTWKYGSLKPYMFFLLTLIRQSTSPTLCRFEEVCIYHSWTSYTQLCLAEKENFLYTAELLVDQWRILRQTHKQSLLNTCRLPLSTSISE